jgi:hypothetical protein
VLGLSVREPAPGAKRRRIALLVVALLAGVLLFTLFRNPKPPPEPPRQVTPISAAPTPTWALPTSVGSNTKPAPSAPPSVEPVPLIDGITVEKPSVCSGEENLVTVKARTTNGTDEFLHYVIDGKLGSSVPVTLWRTDHGVGHHVISVFGRNNAVTTVPLPEFEVRDCVPARIVNVEKHLRANTWADYELVANIATPRVWNKERAETAKPFEPTLYLWSFGDGQNVTTSGAATEHDYEGRPQNSLYSYFVVSVEIHGKDGAVLRGRTSLAMVNPAFEALKQKGIVTLLISLEPRFPELGSDGRVIQQVHLWHTRPDPVRIDQAFRVEYYEQGAGEAPPEMTDVRALLGTDTIPPGPGIRTKVALNAVDEPEVFSVTYRVSGTSAEGLPVSGSFSVMKPPPNPTREKSIAVVDPVLKAKIMAARSMLGKAFVSDEDIWQLERAGKFADLKVQDTPPPAAAPSRASPPPFRPGMTRDRSFEKGPPVPTSGEPAPASPHEATGEPEGNTLGKGR